MSFFRKKSILFGLLILAAAGGFFLLRGEHALDKVETAMKAESLYYCPMHTHYTSDKPGDCPICGMRLVRKPSTVLETPSKKVSKKILFYRNPMDPRITSTVPAKDSMGMDYIPVYTEEKNDPVKDEKEVCIVHECPMIKEGIPCPMLVVGEKGEAFNCPVCKASIELKNGTAPNEGLLPAGYGRILISPEKQQLIGIRTETVSKKKLVKVIQASGKVAYDPELYQTELEYLQTIKKLKGPAYYRNDPVAQNSAERARLKLISLGVPEAMIESIEKDRSADKRLVYAAPGGEAWVYASIFEYEIPLVKPGDLLDIRIPSLPDLSIQAPILYLDNSIDPLTRTLRVRALVKNDRGILKPDMFLDVSIRVDLGEALTVPVEAVSPQGKTFVVFVDKGEGLFEPRRVELGYKTEGVYEVKSGLSDGERVVTNGNFLLDSESRIKAANS